MTPQREFPCPVCNKPLKSHTGLESHIKSKHPDIQPEETPNNQIIVTVPPEIAGKPGKHKVDCPLCSQPTVIEVHSSEAPTITKGPPPPQAHELPPEHPVVIRERMKQREGKKTLVMIGTHPQSLALTPWNENGIDEIWGLNDSHHLQSIRPHFDNMDRWFQQHHRWRFTRRMARKDIDHWEWLQQEHGDLKIYMQREFADIPNSVKYPLREITERLIGGLLPRGAGWTQRYYSTTFSYALALMIYEKLEGINDWERCEIYGCELLQTEAEYFKQRPGMEWWNGYCAGIGIEIYVPMHTRILYTQAVQPNGQLMQFPGYMTYGYMSPSMNEAIAEKQPIGEHPVEENLVGAWEDYPYIDFEYAFNKGFSRMNMVSTPDDVMSEITGLREYEDMILGEIKEPASGQLN